MNKKLMAIAVAGALSAPGFAAAQVGSSPGVTLYGRLDSTIMNNAFSEAKNFTGTTVTNGKVTKGDVFTAGNEMGVRGREAIGGGTSVWFQLAIGVTPDARSEGAATIGNNWGGRNSALGVSSALGDILWGIWDTPYKSGIYTFGDVIASGPFGPGGVIIGNGDSTGALPNAQCGGVLNNGNGTVTTTNRCVIETTGNGSAFSARRSNSIQWWSPRMAGVQVKLMTALYNYKNAETNPLTNGMQSTQEFSGSVHWAQGPVSGGIAFDQRKGFNATNAANAIVDASDKAVIFGAKWNFGPGSVGITLEQLDYGANDTSATPGNKMKLTNTGLYGRWNVGPGAIWAGYSATPGGKSCGLDPTATTAGTRVGGASCGDPGKANTAAIGYDYVMSKRSKLYFAYEKIDNGIDSSYYYIAGPAGNNPGTTGGIARGTDVTSFGVGMQHTF